MSITAAHVIAESLERRQHVAADRRALRKETADTTVRTRTAPAVAPRRGLFRLRTRRVAPA